VTNVTGASWPWTKKPSEIETVDKVFLLSLEEVVRYFGDSGAFGNWNRDGDIYHIDDEYNSARVAIDKNTGAPWWWWLRTRGMFEESVVPITYEGYIPVMGFQFEHPGRDDGGVRPALWLDLQALPSDAENGGNIVGDNSDNAGSADGGANYTADSSAKDTTVDAIDSLSLPAIWLVLLCAAVIALLLLITSIGGMSTMRRPVLALLGGDTNRETAKKRPATSELEETTELPEVYSHYLGIQPIRNSPYFSTLYSQLGGDNHPGIPAQARYISRHIRRSVLKTTLSVVAALCIVLALGWMPMTIGRIGEEIDSLYTSNTVDAAIVSRSGFMRPGAIKKQTVDAVMDSGLIESAYFETAEYIKDFSVIDQDGETVGIEGSNLTISGILYAFNQAERFFSTSGGGIVITYDDGWDVGLFSMPWPPQPGECNIPIVMSAYTLGRFGIDIGDTVYIEDSAGEPHTCTIVGRYVEDVKFGSQTVYNCILLPWMAMQETMGGYVKYATAEFVIDPAMNHMLASVRDSMKAMVEHPDAGNVPLLFKLWDEELRMAVEPMEKNKQLLMALYPVAIMVSVLIAAGLALLLTLQKAKDAAVMRVLGFSKARVRGILCAEHVFVCLIGLFLGLAASVIAWRGISSLGGGALTCAGLYLAGYLLGSAAASVLVTSKMPLELLQVRE
jgi:hypothetical protein